MEEKFLRGYTEEKILKMYNSPESTPVNNPKIQPKKSTLETLEEGSRGLLKEDREFLEGVYQERWSNK